MKKILFILIFSIISLSSIAQYIYKGNTTYKTDIIANVSNGYIYKGDTKYQSNIVANFDGKYLYKGNSRYKSDIICTCVNN